MSEAKPAVDLLSDHVKEEIERWKARFPEGRQRSAVIGALHAVQHENDGYLTADLMNAVADYLDLPLTRHAHTPLLPRMLELRENFSAYDATYVALAELLGASLLTADRALARAAVRHVEVLT